MKLWIWFLPLAGFVVHAQVTDRPSVPLRELRVHVVDARGKPVVGLEPNAFRVSTGERQPVNLPISRFQEVDFSGRRDVNPPPPDKAFNNSHKQRSIVLTLDSSYMNKPTFREFQRAARYYIEHLLGPGDKVKLVHIDNGMIELTAFTDDKQILLSALEKAPYRGSMFRDLKQLERRIIEAVVRHMKGDEGFFANQVNFLVQNKEILKKDYLYAFYSHMLLLEQDLRNRDGGLAVLLLTGGGFVEYNSRGSNTDSYMVRLGEVLNNSDITAYALMTNRGLLPFNAMINNSDFELYNGPDIDDLTLANTGTYPPGGETTNTSNTVFENSRQLETAPRELTERTGGMLTVTRAGELDRALADLSTRIEHYYRLAWTLPKSRMKNLKIELRPDLQNRGYRLFYGREFGAGTPYLKLSARDRRVEFESLLCCSRTFVNQLDADFGYDVFLGEDRTYRISVYARMPGEKMSGAALEVGFALISKDNRIIDITQSELVLQKKKLDRVLYDVLITEQVPAVVRFYVRDLNSGALSLGELPLDAARIVNPGEPLSQVLLSTTEYAQLLVLPRLHNESPKAQLRRIEDPLFIGDRHFLPHVERRFLTPELITFYFHLYSKNPEKYVVALSVRDGGGRHINLGSTLNRVYEYSGRTYRYMGSLDTRSLPPGAYDLLIEITDNESGDRYRRTSRFQVTKEL
ncbi:MAG: hypothetical protein QNK37_17890 [Acidobacteriota bacterium]|nr:hypothetical protein [Acidobacteriota bacterium]